MIRSENLTTFFIYNYFPLQRIAPYNGFDNDNDNDNDNVIFLYNISIDYNRK